MKIALRLKNVLEKHRLDSHGIIQRIADDCEVHRHTVGKLYRNQQLHPSLVTLGKICDWLIEHHVPAQELPQALFGSEPSDLWHAVAERGHVTLYIGEYEQVGEPAPTHRWIARHDAAAAAKIVHFLSNPELVAEHRPTVGMEYVPFGVTPDANDDVLKRDIEAAKKMFAFMQSRQQDETAILVGSQRCNYLLELMVASLFDYEPFQPTTRKRAPIYLCFRHFDRAVPSCFGGHASPPGMRKKAPPGVYFLDPRGQWQAYEWNNDQAAGVIIIVYNPGDESLQLALFGLSGRATSTMAAQLVENAGRFWPPPVESKGRKVGVYVCHMRFADAPGPNGRQRHHLAEFGVTPLSKQVLKSRLH